MNKQANVLMVNRFLSTSMFYPCDYGFIPHTLAEDGDPLDVILLTPYPLLPASVILGRPVGLMHMTDESGPDTKILVVPAERVSTRYQHVQSVKDLDPDLLAGIAHFFAHYKDLEKGKWSKVGDWDDVKAAKEEIMVSIQRYKNEKQKVHV
jgi:inorganic pyrophosphatase